jgi:hypothetical protein
LRLIKPDHSFPISKTFAQDNLGKKLGQFVVPLLTGNGGQPDLGKLDLTTYSNWTFPSPSMAGAMATGMSSLPILIQTLLM